jgi:hypothetical protein
MIFKEKSRLIGFSLHLQASASHWASIFGTPLKRAGQAFQRHSSYFSISLDITHSLLQFLFKVKMMNNT